MTYDWMAGALCATVDHALWFPEKGFRSAAARKICAVCPVLQECAAHIERIESELGPQEGAWAGQNKRQRDAASAAQCERDDRNRTILRLTGEGLSAAEIALQMGCTTRTVFRARTSRQQAVTA